MQLRQQLENACTLITDTLMDEDAPVALRMRAADKIIKLGHIGKTAEAVDQLPSFEQRVEMAEYGTEEDTL